ncbi:MAG: hypothetical protein HQ596_03460 [Candidatus Saganbacteria bacterium]|nr:hypothetical protein [Candidatus Saganbacteria bacterium]
MRIRNGRRPPGASGSTYFNKTIMIKRDLECNPFNLRWAEIGPEHPLAGRRFLLSPSFSSMDTLTMPKFLAVLQDWDISRLSNKHAKVWVKYQNEVLPLMLSQIELGRLSKELNIEVADATIVVLNYEGGKLKATDERVPKGALLADEIREKIYQYLSGRSDTLPPTLFCAIDEQKRVHLLNDPDGKPIFIPIAGKLYQHSPHTLAAVAVLSRDQYKKRIFNPLQYGCKFVTHSFPDGLLLSAKPQKEENGPPGFSVENLPNTRTASFHAGRFIFDNHPIVHSIFMRKIEPPGWVPLTLKRGAQFFLKGLEEIYALGLKRCIAVLQIEDIEGEVGCKTVKLYHPKVDPTEKPDHWFAWYEVYQSCEEGDLLDVRPEFAREVAT